MKIIGKMSIISIVALAVISCKKNPEYFENKAFIISDNMKNEVRVATDEGIETLTRSLEVGMAQPLKIPVTLKLKRSPELLGIYREGWYDSKAELLPEENCNLKDLSTMIRPGDVLSKTVNLTFKNLDKLDYSKSYVLPVSIESNDVGVLPRAKTIYYVIKEASLVNYVANIKTNKAWPVWDGFEKAKDLETFSMEALVNCQGFNNDSKIQTIMGIEDNFLIRIGDVTIPANQIQIACAVVDKEGNSTYRGDISGPSLQLRPDRWYHIAVTFNKGYIKVYLDGRLRAEGDVSAIAQRPKKDGSGTETVWFKKVDFSAPHSDEMEGKPRCFWIGYSYNDDRSLNGMIAEARVWNRVLSAEEINKPNHFYKLYKEDMDESLIAYWKFCEGTGKKIKDYSIYKKDLNVDHTPVWFPVELPTKTKNN